MAIVSVSCNYLDMEERACCLTLIVFLMSCVCQCYMTLPWGALGLSAVFDCGIF